MPLFFFCAGITASFAVHRAPRTFWHKRLLPMVWVLAIVTALAPLLIRLNGFAVIAVFPGLAVL
ncbi:hypothetical protein [Rhodovulum kholense]|uniref:Uncharacterized protein n=1 Tax=Rhodovulum kholense TaxID=453584 RepID=A0A8E3AP70_9RHOB|nr:hypothetical protein [Rhodovulum kholense]PTW44014.1 hypothetical protein C8N38_11913 [Rhodovulum kholense]